MLMVQHLLHLEQLCLELVLLTTLVEEQADQLQHQSQLLHQDLQLLLTQLRSILVETLVRVDQLQLLTTHQDQLVKAEILLLFMEQVLPLRSIQQLFTKKLEIQLEVLAEQLRLTRQLQLLQLMQRYTSVVITQHKERQEQLIEKQLLRTQRQEIQQLYTVQLIQYKIEQEQTLRSSQHQTVTTVQYN
tara:strand:- start:6606 stop:7169 length:564 start_codon:yes stop_codon:yes gene_type:complete